MALREKMEIWVSNGRKTEEVVFRNYKLRAKMKNSDSDKKLAKFAKKGYIARTSADLKTINEIVEAGWAPKTVKLVTKKDLKLFEETHK